MSSSPPSSSSYAPTPEDLARKRARDRKSQRAMRDRTKYSIIELQSRVMELSSTLASQTAAFQDLLQSSSSQAAALRAENQRLKNQLEESRYVGSDMCLENFRFPRSDSVLSELPMPRPLPQLQEREQAQMILSGGASSRKNDEIPIYLRLPVNCAPICLSDRILQSYVQARRNGTKDITTQVMTEDQPAWLPDINALLTPQAPKPSIDNHSVSTVVSDILLSYHEINTLPRKVAVLYIMYKLLNWLIYRTQSTYEQMPGWLRPQLLQMEVPHPAWIDRIAWPNARNYLITHPEITFDDFAMVYSSSFEVSWPYSPSYVIEAQSESGPDRGINLNPVYEQHLRQLKNWTVGDKFRRKFPELSEIIDQDSLLEFWP